MNATTSPLDLMQTLMRGGLRWPMALMSLGVGWMGRMAETAGAGWSDAAAALPTPSRPRGGGATDPQPRKERPAMKDQDLSGDDLKLVRYRVLFTKRELEVAFPEEEHLLTYDARPAEYSGLRIAEFMQRAAEGKIRRPARWVDAEYPDAQPADAAWTIPENDRQYVRFYFEVLDRIPREKAEYDKEQVKVLRQIRDRIA